MVRLKCTGDGQATFCKHFLLIYLPKEEQTKSNFNRSQPDCVEIHHKVHEFLSVGGDQIDNFTHSASPSGGAVYH